MSMPSGGLSRYCRFARAVSLSIATCSAWPTSLGLFDDLFGARTNGTTAAAGLIICGFGTDTIWAKHAGGTLNINVTRVDDKRRFMMAVLYEWIDPILDRTP